MVTLTCNPGTATEDTFLEVQTVVCDIGGWNVSEVLPCTGQRPQHAVIYGRQVWVFNSILVSLIVHVGSRMKCDRSYMLMIYKEYNRDSNLKRI